MRNAFVSSLVLVCLCHSGRCWGQRRADSLQLYERVIAIVPMVGAGTYADPRRPLHAPVLGRGVADRGDGIVGFSYQVSDDGRLAVMELAARDRSAFQALLNDRRPEVRVFERGKSRREEVEAEVRRHIRNFDLTQFGVRAQ